MFHEVISHGLFTTHHKSRRHQRATRQTKGAASWAEKAHSHLLRAFSTLTTKKSPCKYYARFPSPAAHVPLRLLLSSLLPIFPFWLGLQTATSAAASEQPSFLLLCAFSSVAAGSKAKYILPSFLGRFSALSGAHDHFSSLLLLLLLSPFLGLGK